MRRIASFAPFAPFANLQMQDLLKQCCWVSYRYFPFRYRCSRQKKTLYNKLYSNKRRQVDMLSIASENGCPNEDMQPHQSAFLAFMAPYVDFFF